MFGTCEKKKMRDKCMDSHTQIGCNLKSNFLNKSELKIINSEIKIKKKPSSDKFIIRGFFIKNGMIKNLHGYTLIIKNCIIETLTIAKSCKINELIFINCNINKLILEKNDYHLSLLKLQNVKTSNLGYDFWENHINSLWLQNSRFENLKLTAKPINILINNCEGEKIWIKNSSECCLEINNSKITRQILTHINHFTIQNSKFIDSTIYYCSFDLCVIYKTDLGRLNIDPISSILKMYWSNLNEELTKMCMAFDAQNHPNPELFDSWKDRGSCPYHNSSIARVICFDEDDKLWDSELKNMKINTIHLINKLFETKQIKCKWQ